MRSLLPILVFLGSAKQQDRESIGYLTVSELILSCDGNEITNCDAKVIEASGTATRIAWQGEFYWLTAGHVCAPIATGKEMTISRTVKITPLGKDSESSEKMEKAVYREDIDICLMKASPGPARILREQHTQFGENIHTFAFPTGIYHPEMYPYYEGTYNGKIDNTTCITNIPVAPGSSGASVLNEQGQILGVITSVSNSFNHLSMFSCNDATVWFVSEASKTLQKSSSSPEELYYIP